MNVPITIVGPTFPAKTERWTFIYEKGASFIFTAFNDERTGI